VSSSIALGASPFSLRTGMPAFLAASNQRGPVNNTGSSPAARNRSHSASAGNAWPGSGPATTATRIASDCHTAGAGTGHTPEAGRTGSDEGEQAHPHGPIGGEALDRGGGHVDDGASLLFHRLRAQRLQIPPVRRER